MNNRTLIVAGLAAGAYLLYQYTKEEKEPKKKQQIGGTTAGYDATRATRGETAGDSGNLALIQ